MSRFFIIKKVPSAVSLLPTLPNCRWGTDEKKQRPFPYHAAKNRASGPVFLIFPLAGGYNVSDQTILIWVKPIRTFISFLFPLPQRDNRENPF
ncbi:MAG TPA: hypothetical protein DF364_00780 [Ruminococcaceae bacterium]|nr:hypothetical protein [Oscillospiraceae bacterium]